MVLFCVFTTYLNGVRYCPILSFSLHSTLYLWDGAVLVWAALVCSFLLLHSVPGHCVPHSGFLQGVPTFGFSQEKLGSLPSKLDRHRYAPKQWSSHPARKLNVAVGPEPPLLTPAQALGLEPWGPRPALLCRGQHHRDGARVSFFVPWPWSLFLGCRLPREAHKARIFSPHGNATTENL